MDHDFNAVGTKGPSMLVDCFFQLLPWPCVQLTSSKYVVDVKGIALPFAAHVSKGKLISQLMAVC
jgi:hypothetical protein